MAGDCTDVCAVGANWSCVGHVVIPIATQDTIEATLKVVQASSQSTPVAGLMLVGCYEDDYQCTEPLTPVVVTDANGEAVLTLPTLGQAGRSAFQGYVLVTDPAGVYRVDLGFSVPPTSQNGSTQTIVAFTVAEEQELAPLLGLTYDPTKGVLVVTAVDCANKPAPGVTFQVEAGDASVPVLYTFDGIPSQSATRTDSSGTALAGYFSPGVPVTVTARSLTLGRVVATAQVLGRSGAASLVRLAPTP